jgi:hypothetical protein
VINKILYCLGFLVEGVLWSMHLILANPQVNRTHSILKLFIIKTKKLKIFDVQVYIFLRNEILCGFPNYQYDKIPMMMIIETSLYRPSIGFFLITKTITPRSLTMTITNGRLVNNYAPK